MGISSLASYKAIALYLCVCGDPMALLLSMGWFLCCLDDFTGVCQYSQGMLVAGKLRDRFRADHSDVLLGLLGLWARCCALARVTASLSCYRQIMYHDGLNVMLGVCVFVPIRSKYIFTAKYVRIYIGKRENIMLFDSFPCEAGANKRNKGHACLERRFCMA